ncbi:hypothetical protein ANN_22779 [Periplaneta americana]|uniref:Reverse transcriptase domain-containing protein n=1 Tax=Periplaneta americana TaxID=6978 RepID=A0ABQ8SJB6_PERAM|nr:hypothetical protein ANN_22779 [Periplaneta americana]
MTNITFSYAHKTTRSLIPGDKIFQHPSIDFSSAGDAAEQEEGNRRNWLNQHVPPVRTGEEMSEESEIGRGLQQGCHLSPTLFSIYLEALVKNCFRNMEGMVPEGRRIKCIRVADDMALLAEEETILRDMLQELNDSCEQYGMAINAKKTKTMVIGKKNKGSKV